MEKRGGEIFKNPQKLAKSIKNECIVIKHYEIE